MEEQLVIAGLHQADPAAIKEIWHLYKPGIVTMLVLDFNLGKEDIEDIVMETFAAIWLKCPSTITTLRHLRYYLRSTARNKCLNLIKQRKIRIGHEDGLAYMLSHQQLTRQEKQRIEYVIDFVLSHFDDLSPQCKDVLTLHVIEKLSDQAIADKLRITKDIVQSKKSEAIRKLKQMIGNEYPEDPDWLSFLGLLLCNLIFLNNVVGL
jgi:RNA polymerase sigma factor (sigma-70 family)